MKNPLTRLKKKPVEPTMEDIVAQKLRALMAMDKKAEGYEDAEKAYKRDVANVKLQQEILPEKPAKRQSWFERHSDALIGAGVTFGSMIILLYGDEVGKIFNRNGLSRIPR